MIVEALESHKAYLLTLGGPGSGHHGHCGVPGKIGGSRSCDGKAAVFAKEAQQMGEDEFVEKMYKKQRRDQARFKQTIASRLGGKYSAKAKVPDEIASYVGDYGSKISLQDGDIYLGASSHEHTIYVSNIAVTEKGKGLGSMFMQELKKVADETAQSISIYKVTNSKFFEKFDWLTKDKWGDFKYTPESDNFIGVTKLHEIWQEANSMKTLGGPGSGNFGHSGRPGKVGGAAPSNDKSRFDFDRPWDEGEIQNLMNAIADDMDIPHMVTYQLRKDADYQGIYHDKSRGHYVASVADLTDVRLALHEFAHHVASMRNKYDDDVPHGKKFHSATKSIIKRINDWFETGYPSSVIGTKFASSKERFKNLGGPGSGNFGHSGRPGKVGGSAPAEGVQRLVNTETAEFKKWFGNSKVVDAQGNPMVVAHATNAPRFNEFRTAGFGAHFGDLAAAQAREAQLRDFSENVVGRDPGTFRTELVYLSIENPLEMPDMAGLYQTERGEFLTLDEATERIDEFYWESQDERSIYNLHPARWESETDVQEWLYYNDIITSDEFWDVQYDPDAAMRLLKEKGYDGIKYTNEVENPGSTSWIPFEPSQIKSATTNTGAFDPNNPIIYNAALAHDLYVLGGKGSGHHGHCGIPGQVGGSKACDGATRTGPVDTQSKEFKKWFGDSKVVEEDGRPMVVFHGTASKDFSEFDTPLGAFFTDYARVAGTYDSNGGHPILGGRAVERQRIIPVYLSIKNPLEVDGETIKSDAKTRNLISKARSEGYDGLIIRGYDDPAVYLGFGYVSDVFIPLKPTQIKSALTNTGVFDPEDPIFINYLKNLGGKGSGNFGHAGRPGKVGGSAPAQSVPRNKEELVELAKKFYGTTQDPNEAGYILEDGTMLDFSGRHYAQDHPSFRGQRNVDHRELGGYSKYIGYDEDVDFGLGDSDIPAMGEFMVKAGAVRWMAQTGGGSVIGIPTKEQAGKMVAGMHRAGADSLMVDIWDPRNLDLVESVDIERPTPALVKAKIRAVYKANLEQFKYLKALQASYLYTLGGKGSGNFGHAGRPGKVGGSASNSSIKGMPEGYEIGWADYQKELMLSGKYELEVTKIEGEPHSTYADMIIELSVGSPPTATTKEIPWRYSWDDESIQRGTETIDTSIIDDEGNLVDERYTLYTGEFHQTSGHPITSREPVEGSAFRGMSGEEFRNAIATGELKSKGTLNFSQQAGKTLYASNPDQAFSYAGGFAPWYAKPTFSSPSYVVEIERPKNTEINTVAELEIPGGVPVSKIKKVYELRVVRERKDPARYREEWGSKKLKLSISEGVTQHYAFREVPEEEWRALKVLGGKGSGNYGHAGRPGKVGGSAAGRSLQIIGGPESVRTQLQKEHERLTKLYPAYDRAINGGKVSIHLQDAEYVTLPDDFRPDPEFLEFLESEGRPYTYGLKAGDPTTSCGMAIPPQYFEGDEARTLIATKQPKYHHEDNLQVGRFTVSNSFEGALRHESGHHILNKFMFDKIGRHDELRYQELVRAWQLSGAKEIGAKISEYATQLEKEFFCETFAIYSHPDYKGGLPEPAERFVERVLNETSPPEYIKNLGGKGSGNWGHVGRPGKVGGSAPAGGRVTADNPELIKRYESAYNDLVSRFPEVDRIMRESGVRVHLQSSLTMTVPDFVKPGPEDYEKYGQARMERWIQNNKALQPGQKTAYIGMHYDKRYIEGENSALVLATRSQIDQGPYKGNSGEGLYGAGEKRNLNTLVNHEIGHLVHYVFDEESNFGASRTIFNSFGGRDYFKQAISKYAGVNHREMMAECFVVYTSKDFKTGDIPWVVQQKFEEWIGKPQLKALGGKGSGNFGHCGIPGQVGGSRTCSGYGAGVAPNPLEEYSTLIDKLKWREDSFHTGSIETLRKEYKSKVAKDLAAAVTEATGEEVYPHQTSTMVKQWASSSNDRDLRSLSIQKAAAEEFGMELSDWQKENFVDLQGERARLIDKTGYGKFYQPGFQKPSWMTNEEFAFGKWESDAGNKLTRATLRAMYENTQAEFEAAGIKEITVMRGLQIKGIEMERLGFTKAYHSGNREVAMKDSNVLESWTLNPSTARDFIGYGGVVISMKVPVERVMSMPSTGIGCLKEQEVVLLANENDTVRIEHLEYFAQ